MMHFAQALDPPDFLTSFGINLDDAGVGGIQHIDKIGPRRGA